MHGGDESSPSGPASQQNNPYMLQILNTNEILWRKHRTLHEAIYNYEILIYKIKLNIHSRTHSAKRSRIQNMWSLMLEWIDWSLETKAKWSESGFQPLEKYESQLGPFTAQKNKETSTKKKAWCRETFRTFIPKIFSIFSQNLTVRSMIYSWRGCKPAKGAACKISNWDV